MRRMLKSQRKQFIVRLFPKEAAAIQKISVQSGKTLNDVIDDIIKEHLKGKP